MHPLKFASEQMSRPYQEDAYGIEWNTKYLFAAVYDGHCGPRASTWCKLNFPKLLAQQLQQRKSVEDSFLPAFTRAHNMLINALITDGCRAGTTLSAVLICDKKIFTANVGDSLVVLCRNGVAISLTGDDRLGNSDEEVARIRDMGGTIAYNRVCGLNLSRTLGDHYAHPLVNECPHISTVELDDKCEFLIIASDGLWDAITPQKAVESMKEYSDDLEQMLDILKDVGRKSRDNVTIGIISFKDSAPCSSGFHTFNSRFNNHVTNPEVSVKPALPRSPEKPGDEFYDCKDPDELLSLF